jgi:hypothetical protein
VVVYLSLQALTQSLCRARRGLYLPCLVTSIHSDTQTLQIHRGAHLFMIGPIKDIQLYKGTTTSQMHSLLAKNQKHPTLMHKGTTTSRLHSLLAKNRKHPTLMCKGTTTSRLTLLGSFCAGAEEARPLCTRCEEVRQAINIQTRRQGLSHSKDAYKRCVARFL